MGTLLICHGLQPVCLVSLRSAAIQSLAATAWTRRPEESAIANISPLAPVLRGVSGSVPGTTSR